MTPVEQSATPLARTRIFIVDDHPIVRQGLTQMLTQEMDCTVCGEAADAPHALQAIAELQPDLVLVDLSLKGGRRIPRAEGRAPDAGRGLADTVQRAAVAVSTALRSGTAW